jgi:hypothetical protein
MTTVAVMQPYLWPYAGYYRLLAASDVFVVYDCVQFIRRGRIHRNEFETTGGTAWFTLPLAKPGFTDRIDAVRLADDVEAGFAARLRPFPRLSLSWATLAPFAATDAHLLPRAGTSLVDFVVAHLSLAARWLGLDCRIVRSSAFALPDDLRGAARILALCEALQARRYVNVDGGRSLYDAGTFARHDVALQFLAPYRGPMTSVHERLADDPADVARPARIVRAEIETNLVYQ